ncbi:hypothetical protein AMTR_s00180p00037800 [Amborella trichopoda]|uniref:Uncharacterized protein n=1 Tax=Amborella trichopoda TaxID=13333 RepID=W1PX88_AMBTC|nr:hypothetical protein AMTR_s00180p00037800 [Amborella trichopoda]
MSTSGRALHFNLALEGCSVHYCTKPSLSTGPNQSFAEKGLVCRHEKQEWDIHVLIKNDVATTAIKHVTFDDRCNNTRVVGPGASHSWGPNVGSSSRSHSRKTIPTCVCTMRE